MNRRRFGSLSATLLATSCLGMGTTANALSVNDLTNAQASQGLKLVLEKSAIAAVQLLGQPNGFLGNDKVRIPLPGILQDTARLLRSFGQGVRLDELIVAMNHAAETAVPLARDMLVGAVKSMNVQEARKILTGGETSVAQFFAETTRQPLGRKFLPLVTKVTSQVNLAEKYNQIAGKAAGMSLLKGAAFFWVSPRPCQRGLSGAGMVRGVSLSDGDGVLFALHHGVLRVLPDDKKP